MSKWNEDPWIGPQFSTIHRDWEMAFLGLKKLPIVVGITGPTRVGKTMIAKRLATEFGFHYESMSSVLRDVTKMLGEEEMGWRELGKVGIKLREQMGENILAQIIVDRIHKILMNAGRIVIDGIIYPADAKTLSSRTNLTLIGLTASFKARMREARRWYNQDGQEVLKELKQRDEFENYDHDKFERFIGGKITKIERDEKNQYAPDILGCLKRVDNVNLINVGDNTFNVETIFNPTDEIIKRILG